MRLFIIRPFGTKEGIDFDRVERELIQGAIDLLKADGVTISGATTGLISRQGNIREDMFRMIAASDLVIADVSIHNANVFYELGIRHALRPRHTLLMRSATEHAYPFDLQTDRYFLYDAAAPGAGVGALAQALRSTLAASHADSPVFSLLPALAPHGRGQLVRVPSDFREEVALALGNGRRGDLRLLASEAGAFEWDQEGLRLIGDAQFKLRAFAGARDTFELLYNVDRDNVHANLRLGTVYQRLALGESVAGTRDLLARSDQAIERVLADAPSTAHRVEALCLLASNEKTRWLNQLNASAPAGAASATLHSPCFANMLELYLQAAALDLNAHYPAINALALLKIRHACALAEPALWRELHSSDRRAQDAMDGDAQLSQRLTATLFLALELDETMGRRSADSDPWAACSRADFLLLTESARNAAVENAYRRAFEGADRFSLEATRRNLEIYRRFGLFEPGVSAALKVMDANIGASVAVAAPKKVLLFTGHMVDAEGTPQAQARFPDTAAAQARARALIVDAVKKEAGDDPAGVVGVAGGACGDILFHEVCEELGVATELYLALPRAQFEVASVQRGGNAWIERYHALVERKAPHVLQQSQALPKWLVDRPDYNIWQRNNQWLMFNALATGARSQTLIALYNRALQSAGAGGTEDLVVQAQRHGFKLKLLDAAALLEGEGR